MDIKESVLKLKKVIEIYEKSYKDDLIKIKNEIVVIFEKIFNDNYKNYNLTLKNSVYEKIELYSFYGRVKSPESLYEKFIRKNETFNLLKQCEIELDTDVASKCDLIKKYIRNCDDIIGIKITTNLRHDCKEVLKLLRDKINNYDQIKIINIENNSSLMKNGLEINKYKCVYTKESVEYLFELQIKSKIDSAWGDLEHNLFYKDYDFNHAKDINRTMMIHTGKLLEKIEESMFSIRSSKGIFESKYEINTFHKNIYDIYKNHIFDKLGTFQMLDEFIGFLYELYNRDLIGRDTDRNNCLQNSKDNYKDLYDLDIATNDLVLKRYMEIRYKSYNLSTLENIYLNWVCFDIEKEETYETLVLNFVDFLIEYMIRESQRQLGIMVDDSTLLLELVKKYLLNEDLNVSCDDVLLNVKIFNIVMFVYSSIKENVEKYIMSYDYSIFVSDENLEECQSIDFLDSINDDKTENEATSVVTDILMESIYITLYAKNNSIRPYLLYKYKDEKGNILYNIFEQIVKSFNQRIIKIIKDENIEGKSNSQSAALQVLKTKKNTIELFLQKCNISINQGGERR
jgi:ppGpp synthetase/RelA/SpoT-type nucleotidyltranferase